MREVDKKVAELIMYIAEEGREEGGRLVWTRQKLLGSSGGGGGANRRGGG